MSSPVQPPDPLIRSLDPTAIRAAIDTADERARLLRRLLRLALRLQIHLTTANNLTPTTVARPEGVCRG